MPDDKYSLHLKEGHKPVAITDDPHYDLFIGGYIKPEDYLVQVDANRVRSAMALIDEFFDYLETQGILEYS